MSRDADRRRLPRHGTGERRASPAPGGEHRDIPLDERAQSDWIGDDRVDKAGQGDDGGRSGHRRGPRPNDRGIGSPILDARSGQERRETPRHGPRAEDRRSWKAAGGISPDTRPLQLGIDPAREGISRYGSDANAGGRSFEPNVDGGQGDARAQTRERRRQAARAEAREDASSGASPGRFGQRHGDITDAGGRSNRGRRIHIAYVVHSLNAGGTERLALDMARTYSRVARVSILCLDEPGIWAPLARASGLSVHCLWRSPGVDTVTAARIARFCRQEHVNLIHAHQMTPWFYSALARLLYRRPRLLLHEHGRFYPEVYSAKRVRLNRWLLRHFTHKVTAVSADVRDRLDRFEGLPRAYTEVVLNGTVAEPLLAPARRAAWRASLGFGPEHRVIGTVGRLDPIKNLAMWVEAFGRASARMPALRGVIVGDGAERDAIEGRIKARGLGDRIRLTGHRDDARQMTGIFDVFALASRSEGISMAILDAMAAGVPVVATAVGGTPEIIEPPQSGWLVDDEDVQGFASALIAAARDADEAHAVGAAGQRRYQQYFQFNEMIDRYLNIYNDLLGAERALDAELLEGSQS